MMREWPLAMREAQQATGLPVLDIAELSDVDLICELLDIPIPAEASRHVPEDLVPAQLLGGVQSDGVWPMAADAPPSPSPSSAPVVVAPAPSEVR